MVILFERHILRTIGITLIISVALPLPGHATNNKPPSTYKPGLVGAQYDSEDFERINNPVSTDSLDTEWGKNAYGIGWSAMWVGDIVGPANGKITFHAKTNKLLILEIDGKEILKAGSDENEVTGSMKMRQSRRYPIRFKYVHLPKGPGYTQVRWSWKGQPPIPVSTENLSHTMAQEDWWNQAPDFDPNSLSPDQYLTVPDAEQVVVYHEKGRSAAWPANNGIWIWGNEILVGFQQGQYMDNTTGHSFDFDGETNRILARSLDGGSTWTHEVHNELDDKPTVLEKPVDFTHPDFAMRSRGNKFSFSYDRGKTWYGPYLLPGFGLAEKLSARTDYIVEGQQSCLIFLSADEPRVEAPLQDRAFAGRTDDGGLSFKFLGWMSHEPIKIRSVMPSTVRVGPNHLISALRRRVDEIFQDRPAITKTYIDLHESLDNGNTWSLVSKIAATDYGKNNGNPPCLNLLPDGSLCVTYGFRSKPYGIRARISHDNGRTWGKEIHLRDDGRRWDLGYPRTIQRPDGKLVTIYYIMTDERPEMHIEATIWDPSGLR